MAAWLVFLVALGVYVSTTCLTVPAGDSGELIAVVCTRGVAHPPGYPLFTMLGIFAEAVLPFGEPAFRVNLVSAVCGAVATALLFVLSRRLTGSTVAGLVAVVLWALSPAVWSYASVAEVFTLNAALDGLAVLWVVALHQRLVSDGAVSNDGASNGRHSIGRPALLVGLAFGLGMSNHHTTVFVLVAALAFLAIEVARGRVRPGPAGRALGWACAGGVAGLCCYLYLPLAAAADPAVSWGRCDTWAGFWHHLMRRDYGTFQLVTSELAGASGSNLGHVGLFLGRLSTGTLLAMPLLGAVALLAPFGARTRGSIPTAFLLVLLAFVLTGPVFLAMFNAPLEPPVFRGVAARFYILPLWFGAVLAAIGFAACRRWLDARKVDVSPTACAAVPAVLALAMAVLHYKDADQRGNTLVRDYGTNLLRSLPDRAVLFSRGDLATNALDYQRHVLGARPDVAVLDQEKLAYPWFVELAARLYPDVTIPGERYDGSEVQSLTLIEANADRPVLFFEFKERRFEERYAEQMRGLLWEIVPKGRAGSIEQLYATNLMIWEALARDALHPDWDPETFERDAVRRHAGLAIHLGYWAEQLGRLEPAATHYAEAARLDPDRWEPWHNLGVALDRLGRPARAADALERSLRTRPPGPEADAVRRAVDDLRRRRGR